MTILMKVTSRDRPEVLLQTIREYVRLANNITDMKWLFSFDSNDVKYNEPKFLDALHRAVPNALIVFGESESKIHAINRDVNEYSKEWDILLNISDDQMPVVRGYDDLIRNAMPPHLDASLWFYDGWQPRINTQEILGRVYYERFNYIYRPQYKSFFCDNEATQVALELGKMIKRPECIIKHFHPQWDKNSHIKNDDLYKRNDAHWDHDKKVYATR